MRFITACRRSSRPQEQANVVVVHDFTLRADREVRRNEPCGACELPGPLGHFPNDRAPLETINAAGSQHSLPHGLERQPASLAVADAPDLDERSLAGDLHLRLKGDTRTWPGFQFGLDAFGGHGCPKDLAAGRSLSR